MKKIVSIHIYYFSIFFFRQDPPRIDRTPTRIKPKFKIHDEFKTDWLKFDIGKEEIFVIIYFLLHQKMIFILISFDEFFVFRPFIVCDPICNNLY